MISDSLGLELKTDHLCEAGTFETGEGRKLAFCVSLKSPGRKGALGQSMDLSMGGTRPAQPPGPLLEHRELIPYLLKDHTCTHPSCFTGGKWQGPPKRVGIAIR